MSEQAETMGESVDRCGYSEAFVATAIVTECGHGKHIAWFDSERCRCGEVSLQEADSAVAAPVSPAPDRTTQERIEQAVKLAMWGPQLVLAHPEPITDLQFRAVMAAAREFGLIAKEHIQRTGNKITAADLDRLLADLSAPSEQET